MYLSSLIFTFLSIMYLYNICISHDINYLTIIFKRTHLKYIMHINTKGINILKSLSEFLIAPVKKKYCLAKVSQQSVAFETLPDFLPEFQSNFLPHFFIDFFQDFFLDFFYDIYFYKIKFLSYKMSENQSGKKSSKKSAKKSGKVSNSRLLADFSLSDYFHIQSRQYFFSRPMN